MTEKQLLCEIREESNRQLEAINQIWCEKLREQLHELQTTKWDAALIPDGDKCTDCPYLVSETAHIVDMFGNRTGDIRATFRCKWFGAIQTRDYDRSEKQDLECYKCTSCKLRGKEPILRDRAQLTYSTYPETGNRLNEECW